jgi:putative peptide modification system cyclase
VAPASTAEGTGFAALRARRAGKCGRDAALQGDRHMNALAQPAAPIAQSAAIPLLRTLVLCDLVDSTALTERLGDRRAADLFRKHDRLARALLPLHGGREIDKTDGFLLMFERPLQAVAFALDYQSALRDLNATEGSTLAARIGIHVGDLVVWDNSPDDIARGAKPIEIEGLVKPITARLMQLALPNQILLSGVAQALAHRAQGELGERLVTVRWRTHGRYRFKGIPDPIPVFEVGDEGFAPLKAPPWSGKAHREVPFWRRPATLGIELATLLALLAVPAWYVLKPAPAIAFAQRDWVVVGDLRNLTGDTSFDASVQTAFRIGLEQSRYVNVLSTLKARETVQLMQRDPENTPVDRIVGAEIAIRDGARAVILPTIAEIGGRVRVTAEVVDPRTQTTVYSESADGVGAESVLPSLDVVNQKLRVRLGEALATVSKDSRPLEKVATKNLDALRAYSLGLDAYGRNNMKEAALLFQQALQFDPQFARARITLGECLAYAGDNPGATAEMRKAASADNLMPRDALYAKAWLANFENPRAALQGWRVLAKLYPDFPRASGALGFFEYRAANDIPAAIAATEQNAVNTNPRRNVGDYLLGVLYLSEGRYAEAGQRFDQADANGFKTQNTYRAYLFAAQRDFAKASALLSKGTTSGIESEDAELWRARALLALDRGDWDTALAEVAGPRVAAIAGDPDRQITALMLRSLSDTPAELQAQASTYLREWSSMPKAQRESDTGQFNVLLVAYLAARAGALPVAATALDRVTAQSRGGDYPYLASLLKIVEAEKARASGDAKKSISILEPTVDGREYYLTHRALMDAYAATNDYANALRESHWLATHRGRAYAEQFGQATLNPLNVALANLALLHAAEIASAQKELPASHQALADFRKAWPGADTLPFLKRRLEALADADRPH